MTCDQEIFNNINRQHRKWDDDDDKVYRQAMIALCKVRHYGTLAISSEPNGRRKWKINGLGRDRPNHVPICTGYRLFARNPDSNHLSSSSWRKRWFHMRPSVSNAIRGDVVLEKSSTRINLMTGNLARWTETGEDTQLLGFN